MATAAPPLPTDLAPEVVRDGDFLVHEPVLHRLMNVDYARLAAIMAERAQRVADGATAPVELRVPIAVSSDRPYTRWGYTEILGHDAEEVDTSYLERGLSVLTDHTNRISAIVGRFENWRLESGRLRGEVLLDDEDEDAKELYKKVVRGYVRFISVGYTVQRWTLVEETETSATYRAVRWTPMEASFVAVPADVDVGTYRARAANPSRDGAARVRVPLDRASPAPQARSNDVSMTATAAPAAAPTPAAPAVPDSAARSEALAELAGLTQRDHQLGEWIRSGRSVDEIRSEVLAQVRAAAAPATVARASTVVVGNDRATEEPWEAADFFRAVVRAARTPDAVDPRLLATRAQNTQSGPDGGFAVPPGITNMLLEASRTGGELLARVTQRPVTVGNTYTETVLDESSRADGVRNGGVRGYWLAEDGNFIESQAKTRQIDFKLKKLGIVAKLTEEQVEDGPAMDSFLREQAPEEIRFKTEQAIWEGSGAGQPLGFMNGGGLVTVAIEAGQTIANTNANIWMNAAKMFARMPARMLPDAAWFINQELWAKILTAVAGSAGAHPMFTPPGRLESAPNGAIYGKPIVPVEYASAEGTVGDFVFANLRDYLLADKGTIRSSVSMHVEFLRDRQVLKFVYRVDGAPRTSRQITPFKGGATHSPYIALAARS